MKQNVKNLKQETVYKRRRIAVFAILVVLLVLIVSIYASTTRRKIANMENKIQINGADIDISGVISKEPNPPHLGAGMIPIKWNSDKGSWVITTKDDIEWYDYANGKWANIMLSDGVYSSELERGKLLASDYVGASIARPEDLGTIYTWIPRLCYLEDRVEFLNDNSILDYKWTTESCFNLEGYGAKGLDLAFTGIWVGQTEYESLVDVETKNNAMNTKENTVGIIANEKVNTITASDKTAVKKLFSKYSISENETTLKNIDTMANRQTIKIVNTNKRIPLAGTYTTVGDDIQIGAKYEEKMYKYSFDKNGEILPGNKAKINNEEIRYTFYLVDSIGNIRRYSISYGSGRPYLKGFSKNNTFYVTYDDQGNETSEVPIGETAPADWYDYTSQRWANIVVRDNGNESYYTWIPRYMYKLDEENQKVEARLVDLENKDTETRKRLK